jgi:hypothetical protein
LRMVLEMNGKRHLRAGKPKNILQEEIERKVGFDLRNQLTFVKNLLKEKFLRARKKNCQKMGKTSEDHKRNEDRKYLGHDGEVCELTILH